MKPALKWGIAGAAGIAIALAIKNISDENEETAEQTKLELNAAIAAAQEAAQEAQSTKSAITVNKKMPDANFINKLETAFQTTPNWSEFSGQSAAGSEGAWFGLKRSNDYNPIAYCMIVSFDNIYAARRFKEGWQFTQFLNENNIA